MISLRSKLKEAVKANISPGNIYFDDDEQSDPIVDALIKLFPEGEILMADDEVVHNVFDNAAFRDGEKVPVTVDLGGGKKITVGEATVVNTGGMVHIEMDLKNDAPDEVVEFLKQGITGMSYTKDGEIADISVESPFPDHAMTYEEAQAVFEFPDHHHKAVQHRDGKPPWCNVCKLTTGYLVPPSPNWFGKPSLPIHQEGEN